NQNSYLMSAVRTAGRFIWLADFAAAARQFPRHPAHVPRRLTYGIDLDRVSFRYPGREAPVLSEIDLHLPAGSVVALVGENGAGKTTLVKLLHRFYEPSAGTIRVDGQSLADFEVDEW